MLAIIGAIGIVLSITINIICVQIGATGCGSHSGD